MISSDDTRGPFDSFVTALVDAAASAAGEKLAHDTVVLDLRQLIDSFDALVVTSGGNDRQVRSIAEEIERVIDQLLMVRPLRVEGRVEGQWIALDYGDVIVHIFDDASRGYYDLEHLWNAAPVFRPEGSR